MNLTPEQEAVCARAIQVYGEHEQIDQAIEELAELIVALRHARRFRATMLQVATEIADVAIMVEQLATIYGKDAVQSEINAKIQRLDGRLNANHP